MQLPHNSQSLHFACSGCYKSPLYLPIKILNIRRQFKMNRNSRFVSFNSLIIGLFIALILTNISAQNKVSAPAGESTKTCAGKFVMPASIEVTSDVFGDYLRVASLSGDKRSSAWTRYRWFRRIFTTDPITKRQDPANKRPTK